MKQGKQAGKPAKKQSPGKNAQPQSQSKEDAIKQAVTRNPQKAAELIRQILKNHE